MDDLMNIDFKKDQFAKDLFGNNLKFPFFIFIIV